MGGMKVRKPCYLYEVPRSTVRNKLSGKAETWGRVRRNSVLGENVEDQLVQWMKKIAEMSFIICQKGLHFSIGKLVSYLCVDTQKFL